MFEILQEIFKEGVQKLAATVSPIISTFMHSLCPKDINEGMTVKQILPHTEI